MLKFILIYLFYLLEMNYLNKPVMITADSTCDLPSELLERFNIKTIPLTIQLGDETFLDGEGFTPEVMYRRYREVGTLPNTAAAGYQQVIDFFSQFTKAGYQVVHLDISSELSCSFSNGCLAAEDLGDVFPVDSQMLSSGLALLAIEGAECRDKGMGAQEIAEHLRSLTGKVDTSFVLDTLEFMWKGGRCSAVASLGANLLKLKPALEMKDGKLGVYKKYRGSIDSVYKQYIKERIAGKNIRPGHVFITNSGEIDPEVIRQLAQLVRELIPVEEIHFATAGCTISSHCGPKCLGVLFINQ